MKYILIIGGIVIILILTFGEDTYPEPKKILYLNQTKDNFNILNAGNSISPSHPLIGWIILIIGLMILYRIIHNVL